MMPDPHDDEARGHDLPRCVQEPDYASLVRDAIRDHPHASAHELLSIVMKKERGMGNPKSVADEITRQLQVGFAPGEGIVYREDQ